MDVSHINPFVRSAQDVFATMLGCQIKRTGLDLKNGSVPTFEINGLIAISGSVSGSVVFSLSPDVAFEVVKALLGEDVCEVTPVVTDAVGELTNMIAGNAKKELSQSQLDLGLPTVFEGKGPEIPFPDASRPICIRFDTDWGPMSVEVGLATETPLGAGA